MKDVKQLFGFILFILMLCQCTSDASQQLADADAVMEEFPDSSLMILKRMDPSNLNSKDRSYYALLLTQAQVKTDCPEVSDSVIGIALQKFDGDMHGNRKIRANFYMGEVLNLKGESRAAMMYFLNAYEESKRLDNEYWRAKAAERISDLFCDAYNYDEAAKYAREAAKYYGKSGKILNHRYALCDLAVIQLNNCNYVSAVHLLDSLHKICKTDPDTDPLLLNQIERSIIAACIDTNSYSAIDSLGKEVLDLNVSALESLSAAIMKSKIQFHSGNFQESIRLLEEARNLPSCKEEKLLWLYAYYEIARNLGDNQIAMAYVDSLIYLQEAVTANVVKESVTAAQRDYYSIQTATIKHKNKKLIDTIFLAFLLFLATLLYVWRLHILKSKMQKAKLNESVKEILLLKSQCDRMVCQNKELTRDIASKTKMLDGLKESLKENELTVAALQNINDAKLTSDNHHAVIVENLFKEKWTTLNHLCDEYFETGDSEKSKTIVFDNIRKELQVICSKKGVLQIVRSVDEYMGGIVTLLRSEFPALKEQDIEFIALVFAGFSTKAICMFMNIKSGNFYVKKKRLEKKILESDAPNKDLFIKKYNS